MRQIAYSKENVDYRYLNNYSIHEYRNNTFRITNTIYNTRFELKCSWPEAKRLLMNLEGGIYTSVLKTMLKDEFHDESLFDKMIQSYVVE